MEKRFICWVKPYPHVDNVEVQKALSFLGVEFIDDGESEIQFENIPSEVINKFNSNGLYDDNSIFTNSSYFYEFDSIKEYKVLQKKLPKIKEYCMGWVQHNT